LFLVWRLCRLESQPATAFSSEKKKKKKRTKNSWKQTKMSSIDSDLVRDGNAVTHPRVFVNSRVFLRAAAQRKSKVNDSNRVKPAHALTADETPLEHAAVKRARTIDDDGEGMSSSLSLAQVVALGADSSTAAIHNIERAYLYEELIGAGGGGAAATDGGAYCSPAVDEEYCDNVGSPPDYNSYDDYDADCSPVVDDNAGSPPDYNSYDDYDNSYDDYDGNGDDILDFRSEAADSASADAKSNEALNNSHVGSADVFVPLQPFDRLVEFVKAEGALARATSSTRATARVIMPERLAADVLGVAGAKGVVLAYDAEWSYSKATYGSEEWRLGDIVVDTAWGRLLRLSALGGSPQVLALLSNFSNPIRSQCVAAQRAIRLGAPTAPSEEATAEGIRRASEELNAVLARTSFGKFFYFRENEWTEVGEDFVQQTFGEAVPGLDMTLFQLFSKFERSRKFDYAPQPPRGLCRVGSAVGTSVPQVLPEDVINLSASLGLPYESVAHLRDPSGEYTTAATVLLYHVYVALCGGRWEAFRAILLWLAHAVQRPHERPKAHVSFATSRKEGVGKSILLEILLQIFGRSAHKEQSVSDAVSALHPSVALKTLVVFDEFSNITPKQLSTLKDQLTSATIRGKQIGEHKNVLRALVFGNNVSRALDGRRWIVPPAGDRYLEFRDRASKDNYFTFFCDCRDANDKYAVRTLSLLLHCVDLDAAEFNPHADSQFTRDDVFPHSLQLWWRDSLRRGYLASEYPTVCLLQSGATTVQHWSASTNDCSVDRQTGSLRVPKRELRKLIAQWAGESPPEDYVSRLADFDVVLSMSGKFVVFRELSECRERFAATCVAPPLLSFGAFAKNVRSLETRRQDALFDDSPDVVFERVLREFSCEFDSNRESLGNRWTELDVALEEDGLNDAAAAHADPNSLLLSWCIKRNAPIVVVHYPFCHWTVYEQNSSATHGDPTTPDETTNVELDTTIVELMLPAFRTYMQRMAPLRHAKYSTTKWLAHCPKSNKYAVLALKQEAPVQ
jgi:hypothetical protein